MIIEKTLILCYTIEQQQAKTIDSKRWTTVDILSAKEQWLALYLPEPLHLFSLSAVCLFGTVSNKRQNG